MKRKSHKNILNKASQQKNMPLLGSSTSMRNKILQFYEKYMIFMGIAGHFIFIFQTYKIITNKNAAGVSLEGFIVAFLSIISWLFYGSLKKDKVLIIVNIFGLLASSICLIAIISLR